MNNQTDLWLTAPCTLIQCRKQISSYEDKTKLLFLFTSKKRNLSEEIRSFWFCFSMPLLHACQLKFAYPVFPEKKMGTEKPVHCYILNKQTQKTHKKKNQTKKQTSKHYCWRLIHKRLHNLPPREAATSHPSSAVFILPLVLHFQLYGFH